MILGNSINKILKTFNTDANKEMKEAMLCCCDANTSISYNYVKADGNDFDDMQINLNSHSSHIDTEYKKQRVNARMCAYKYILLVQIPVF